MSLKTPGFLVLTAIALAGCGGKSVPDPEVEHCAIIAGRATQVYGAITIVRVHDWVLGDVKGVQMRFAYPPEYSDFRFGNITCTYDYAVETRRNPERVIRVQSVYFRGRYLSESELKFLNTSPFRPQPEFKLD